MPGKKFKSKVFRVTKGNKKGWGGVKMNPKN